MKPIYLLSYNESSPGVNVILNALVQYFSQKDCCTRVVRRINDIPTTPDVYVFSYGPKETYDLIKAGKKCDLAMLVDYYSEGQKNKTSFYLKLGLLGYKDLYYSFLTSILYRRREKYILKHVKDILLVSQTDIEKLKRISSENNFFLLPNGVKIPTDGEVMVQGHKGLRLGILSNWNWVSVSECKWFLDKYLPKIIKELPDIKLIIAGKGADDRIKSCFESYKNVVFLGEVGNLSDFFSQINIYLATVPRGCGILNKVLDAFAYKKLVVGIPQSFTGFQYMEKSFIECVTAEDFIKVFKDYLNNPLSYNSYINNAFQSILKYNCWEKNYIEFINELLKKKVISE